MKNTKVYTFSIIIPCLNEEDYIENCIESIINQDYDIDKIEIILVDGGSSDKTILIISSYQNKFSNIKIYHNPHKSTPISLNIGIKRLLIR